MFSGVKESNGDNEKILSLSHDLENQGQTPFCMTFLISGWKHDTKSILVLILTFSRLRISNMLKKITWPWRLILELKVTHIHCMTFLSSGCIHAADLILVSILTFSKSRISENPKSVTWPWWLTLKIKVKHVCVWPFVSLVVNIYRHDLCIDFNNFEAWDVENVKTIHVSQTFDLVTQGHTHLSYDLAYLRLYAYYWLDLGVDSNILNVEDLKKPKISHLTLMVDLDFQGQTIFFEIIIIFKVSHHSYIIYFRFFEFLDLDYVKINTKIKSVSCIQPEIIKVIQNYVWSWFSRSTIKVRWHMLIILRFPTSVMFKSTARKSLYHVYNPWWTMGHNK